MIARTYGPARHLVYRHGLRMAAGMAAALCLFAVGCGSHTDNLYADYHQRLGNVLSVPAPQQWHPGSPEPAPSASDWRVEIPDVRATPVAVWRVRHCALFDLLGERNSILGRVAEPGLRWHYEARLLTALADCLADKETGESAAEDLRSWQEDKQAAWPRATWNGTFGTQQVRDVWQVSQRGLDPASMPATAPLGQALEQLTRWASEWPDTDPVAQNRFSEPYEQLSRQDIGGQWRRSAVIAAAGLEAANNQLQAAVAADRLCPQGSMTRDGTFARNVLMDTYIGRIQPFHADLDRVGTLLLTRFDALARATGWESDAWNRFYRGLEKRQSRLQQASRRHADLWGELLNQCGLSIQPAP